MHDSSAPCAAPKLVAAPRTSPVTRPVAQRARKCARRACRAESNRSRRRSARSVSFDHRPQGGPTHTFPIHRLARDAPLESGARRRAVSFASDIPSSHAGSNAPDRRPSACLHDGIRRRRCRYSARSRSHRNSRRADVRFGNGHPREGSQWVGPGPHNTITVDAVFHRRSWRYVRNAASALHAIVEGEPRGRRSLLAI